MTKPIKLGEFLNRAKIPVKIDPNKDYSLVTVKLYHKGVILREKKKGALLGSNMYRVSPGHFILSGIDARNGAFGIVPPELDGAIVTNDFWYFDVDETKVKRDFFFWLTNTPLFLDACIKSSKGETQRIRLQKDLFYNFEFHFPPVEQQESFLKKIQRSDNILGLLGDEVAGQSKTLTQLRQAILQEAIEGKLTAEWRGKTPPGLPQASHFRTTPAFGHPSLAGGEQDVSQSSPPVKGEWPLGRGGSSRLNSLPPLKYFRKKLRSNLTPAEAKLWTMLQGKKLGGKKFRRQHSFGRYIMDFYCTSDSLAIELDGEVHNSIQAQEYDEERTLWLEQFGLRVLRFENKEVFDNPDGVLAEIGAALGEGNPSVSPLASHLPLTGEEQDSSLSSPPAKGEYGEAGRGFLFPQKELPAEYYDATALLEKIKQEKMVLAKGAKPAKKEKELPPIDPSEVPFALPEGWMWTRLGEICSKIGSGSTPKGSDYAKEGTPFFRSQNIHDSGLDYDDIKFISKKMHEKMKGTIVIAQDILLNITGGSLGRCALVPETFDEGNVSQHVCIIRPMSVQPTFFHKLMLSPHTQRLIFDSTTGAGREGLPKYNLEQFAIPLPPLAEQHAIVERVDKLLAMVDQLEQQVAERKVHAEELMQAVLREAFSQDAGGLP